MDTLVQTCRARERLGTLKIQLPQQKTVIRGTRGADVCASLFCRGKPQERVALWRETFESWLVSSKRSPFFQVVRCEGHTERGTMMEGRGLLVHNIQVQQSKAGAAGGEEEAQFPRVLMQQGMTRRRRRGGREREEKKAKDNRSCQGETGYTAPTTAKR